MRRASVELPSSTMRVALPALLALWACDDGRTVPVSPPSGRTDAAVAADGAAAADDAAAELTDGALASDAMVVSDAGIVGDAAPSDPDGGAPAGDAGAAPIPTTPGAWVWADFPESACDEGTPTGIGVNASSSSSDLLIFLNGGGACWDYTTCVQLNTSTHGPFTAASFQQISSALRVGAFDRGVAANPFRDYSYVFVPYCTGDLHAGSRVAQYTSGAATRTIHHVGHLNVLAYLARLGATFPNARKVVVAGSSAGGFGTVFSYDAAHATWPNAELYLVDDSGPLLGSGAISPALQQAWSAAWGNDALIDQLCGTACRSDFSLVYGALARRYPTDRLALLSSLRDATIRQYLGLQPAAFEAALLAAAQDAIEPTANFEYFLVPGETHTMLGAPERFSSSSVSLYTWLTRMVEDDAAWVSTRP